MARGPRASTPWPSARSSRARTWLGSPKPSRVNCESSGLAAGATIEPPPNVVWLGEVGDDELATLYRGASCLVYASLYEGYGLPVAEALACGCPIVTTAGSPMQEIAGADATYVDPADVESIREGIARAFRPEPKHVASSWTDVVATTRRRSTRRSRDPDRRGCARPPPHRRRDLRDELVAGIAARLRPICNSWRSRRHPELVPDGVEAVELPARSQELRMAWTLPRLLRRLKPELAHFQHALPLGYRRRAAPS